MNTKWVIKAFRRKGLNRRHYWVYALFAPHSSNTTHILYAHFVSADYDLVRKEFIQCSVPSG